MLVLRIRTYSPIRIFKLEADNPIGPSKIKKLVFIEVE